MDMKLMCDIAHTSVPAISQYHHRNSLIDIHTAHKKRSRVQKESHRVNEP